MENKYSRQLSTLFRQFIREEILQSQVGQLEKTDIRNNFSKSHGMPLGWRRSIIKLKDFYEEIYSRRLIICSLEEFKALFIGDSIPINWYGTLKELAYIFNSIMDLRIINNSKKLHKLLANNFFDSNGQILNEGSLKSTLKRVRHGKPDPDLDLIIATCQ